MRPVVARIGELEAGLQAKTDAELQAMTPELKRRLDKGEPLDEILPEAFAVCREAGRRVLGMRHFDVQLMGGMVLHRGGIAEMKTGEGKTLVATLPVYLNALAGKGVHVITVNDYLARRDSEWMGRIYKFLGLSVGIVVHGLTDAERQRSYRSDIAYGTNSEFGFDYLRDNMKDSIERYVQRDLNYAIVDEVDSILIDEARTPLIISGPAEQSADLYQKVNAIIPGLRKDIDYTVDEKAHSAILTDTGIERVEQRLGVGNLYNPENIEWLHHVTQALRAHTLYKRDVNYLIEEGKILIVDEFTGRKMPGRRWSDGLHQAIEAKEGVEVQEENQTLATISYQNYFRLYKKLAGMTGTADTEAEEFHKIYKLDVTVVPTNKPMLRAGPPRRGLQERARQVPRGASPSSRTATSAGSRCWSAPSASRSPRWSRRCCARRTSRTTSSTPSSTSARRTSSRRRAARARSPSRPTWRAAGPTSSWAATPSSWRAPRSIPRNAGQARRRGRPREVQGGLRALQAPVRRREAGGAGRGRPAHPRHRAPRIAPHRQPAARPRGPPGRSRVQPLLPVAGRRPHAHLRRRAHHRASWSGWGWRRTSPSSTRSSTAPSRTRRRRSRGTTSTSARTCSSTTTS